MSENLHVEFSANTTSLERGIGQVLNRLQQLLAGSNRASQATNRLSDSFDRSASESRNFNNSIYNSIGSLAKFASGTYLAEKALSLLKQGLQITSDIQRLNASLQAVSVSSLDYNRTQNLLLSTSDQLGVSYEALASSYKSLKAATNGTVLEGAKTEKIFLAITRAGASLKLSNEEVKGSLLAVQQMISKGTVSAEELRGQLGERLPGAFRLFAQSMGVSERQLGKMLEQGQVAATDVLPKFAEKLEQTFGKNAQDNVNTIAGGFTRATDQLKLFIAEFSAQNGIDTFFANLGNGIANYIKLIRVAQTTGGPAIILNENVQKRLNTFRGLNPEQQQAQIDRMAAAMQKEQAQLDFITTQVPRTATLQKELKLEESIKRRRQELELFRREARRQRLESEQTVNDAGGNVMASYDKLQSDLKAVEEKIKNILASGNTVPSELKKQYEALKAKDEAVKNFFKTGTTGNFTSQLDNQTTILGIYKARLKDIENQIDSLVTSNEPIPKQLSSQREGYKLLINELERVPEALKLPEKLNSQGSLTDKLSNSDTFRKRLSSPLGRLSEQLNGQIGKNLGIVSQQSDIKQALNEFPSLIDGLKQQYDNLAKTLDPNSDAFGKILASANKLKDVFKQLKDSIKEGATDILSNIGEAIGSGKNPAKVALQGVLNLIAQYVGTIGKAMFISAIPLLSNPLTASLGSKQLLTGGLLTVASGVVRGLASNIPAMAEGGLLTGPRVVLAGEAGNEAILPIRKIVPLMADAIQLVAPSLNTAAPNINSNYSPNVSVTGNRSQQIEITSGELRLSGTDIFIPLLTRLNDMQKDFTGKGLLM